MEFLVGTFLGVMSIAVAYKLFFWQYYKSLKRLHFSGNSIDLTPNLPEVISSRISVSYQGETLIHPRICLLRIRNTGGAAIMPSDFDGPMVMNFGFPSRFLCSTINMDPVGLLKQDIDKYSLDKGKFAIDPFLMNPGDQFESESIVDCGFDPPSVEARIADSKEVRSWPPVHDGLTAVIHIRSIIYDLRKDWPGEPFVFSLMRPVLASASGTVHRNFSVLLDGRQVDDAHIVSLGLAGDYGDIPFDRSMQIEFDGANIVHVEANVGDVSLSKNETRHLMKSSGRRLTVRRLKSESGDDVNIVAVLSGRPDDVRAVQIPSTVVDVQMGELDFEGLIENNLSPMGPDVLMFNHRIFRSYYDTKKMAVVWLKNEGVRMRNLWK